MNKRYVAERYADLKGQTPIEFNFYNLQALFTNHIFLPGKQYIEPKQFKRFKLNQEGSTAEIKIKDSIGLLYTFFADGEESYFPPISPTRPNNTLCNGIIQIFA